MVRLAPDACILYNRKIPKKWPILYRWCIDNGYTAKNKEELTKQKMQLTHTILDNMTVNFGVISIPDNNVDQFFDAYTKSVYANECIYVSERVEKPDSPRRLYMDFDMKMKCDMTNVDELYLFKEMIGAVFLNVCQFSVDAKEMRVLSAGMTGEKDVNRVVISSRLGLHFVWPRFIVNQATSLAIRRSIVLELGTRFSSDDSNPHHSNARLGEYELTSPWSEVVDLSVLNNQNLRMPYSRKAKQARGAGSTCACGAMDNPNLGELCRCFKKTCDLSRPYVPLLRVYIPERHDNMPAFELLDHETVLDILYTCTIRSTNVHELSATSIRDTDFLDIYAVEVDSREAATRGGKPKDISPAALSLINDYCHTRWRRFVSGPGTVKAKRSSNSIIVPLTNRCPNAFKSHHTNACTYLVFTSDGRVTHHCMSEKVAKRRFVGCYNRSCNDKKIPVDGAVCQDEKEKLVAKCEDLLSPQAVAVIFGRRSRK
jgi:hypothetical protein